MYPFPQPLHLIKNKNFDAFDMEGNNYVGDYPGLNALQQWTKYGFVQAVSFEHRDAGLITVFHVIPIPQITSSILNGLQLLEELIPIILIY